VLSRPKSLKDKSQAVPIAAAIRFATDRVQMSPTPQGDLFTHPCGPLRGQALVEVLAGFDGIFVAALEHRQAEKKPLQERESL
jgi:hypothetical protein